MGQQATGKRKGQAPGRTRRRFLGEASLLAAGVAAGIYLPLGAARARAEARGRVVVVGAGLAGLAAAMELRAEGVDVVVLEALDRPGGRVQTLREPFSGGLYAEAGAVAFSSRYQAANRIIDQLGVERADWALSDLPQLFHLRGRRFTAGPGDPPDWPYPLTPEEQALGPAGLVRRYLIDPLPGAAAEPAAWTRPPLAELDRITLGDFMRRQGASEGAVALVADTQWFGETVRTGSALSGLVTDIGLFAGGVPFVLAGGNDALPRAMAGVLGERVRYGVQVSALNQDDEGVEVVGRSAEGEVRLRAERVVCTLPAWLLGTLEMTPAPPAGQRRAFAELPYLATSRAYFQVERGFWHDEGVSAGAATDLVTGEVARQPYSMSDEAERPAILEWHVRGPGAVDFAGGGLEGALEAMVKIHPRVREFRTGGHFVHWGSAYCFPRTGQVTGLLEDLRSPHGRIHFAGEHTSILRATMEGALRSGLRAAREVLAG